jgi:hypothetical protein
MKLKAYMEKQIEMLKAKLEQERTRQEKIRSERRTAANDDKRVIKIYVIDHIKQNIQYWESELRVINGEETAAGR